MGVYKNIEATLKFHQQQYVNEIRTELQNAVAEVQAALESMQDSDFIEADADTSRAITALHYAKEKLAGCKAIDDMFKLEWQ